MPTVDAIDSRAIAVLLALLDRTPPQPSTRDLQQSATQILATLLAADTPLVSWHVGAPAARFVDLFVADPIRHPVLVGQADSHAAVRDFATHFDVEVHLKHGEWPIAATAIDGIGVQVWCAPEYRDDTITA